MTNADNHLIHFASLQDAYDLVLSSANAKSGVSTARVVSYARRSNAVSNLEIERALRESQSLRLIHHRALASSAQAMSEMAAAAAGGTQVVRMVGAHRLELIEEGDAHYLVIELTPPEARVGALEVRTATGLGGRINLPLSLGGIIQLQLNSNVYEQEGIHSALLEPDSKVYLF